MCNLNFKFIQSNSYFPLRNTLSVCRNAMSTQFKGEIAIPANQLDLDLSLLGGQSFRWSKFTSCGNTEWRGVAYGAYWVLAQNADAVTYRVHPCGDLKQKRDAAHFRKLLAQYLRVDFDLQAHCKTWKLAHSHFAEIGDEMKAVRLLDQEPLENIVSFICSQNNHIKRISTMIQWFCEKYGKQIGKFHDNVQYTFPDLDVLASQQKELEANLRAAKFGYRAKFIAQAVTKIIDNGGEKWLRNLRDLPYEEAREELVTLPGIGFKVADCICLMSLNHLQSVPVDTHIYKIAQMSYMPELAKTKNVTPKIYDQISSHFREVYGPFAGWTQAVLFCSGLQQFQKRTATEPLPTKKKKKKSGT